MNRCVKDMLGYMNGIWDAQLIPYLIAKGSALVDKIFIAW